MNDFFCHEETKKKTYDDGANDALICRWPRSPPRIHLSLLRDTDDNVPPANNANEDYVVCDLMMMNDDRQQIMIEYMISC